MDSLLETITEKEREVITLRYGINDNIHRTLEDVGEKLNLSRERIRQIEVKAFRKLLHPSRMCSITNTKKRHIEINKEIEDYSIGVKYSSGLINILKSEIRKYLNCDVSVRNYFILNAILTWDEGRTSNTEHERISGIYKTNDTNYEIVEKSKQENTDVINNHYFHNVDEDHFIDIVLHVIDSRPNILSNDLFSMEMRNFLLRNCFFYYDDIYNNKQYITETLLNDDEKLLNELNGLVDSDIKVRYILVSEKNFYKLDNVIKDDSSRIVNSINDIDISSDVKFALMKLENASFENYSVTYNLGKKEDIEVGEGDIGMSDTETGEFNKIMSYFLDNDGYHFFRIGDKYKNKRRLLTLP